MRLHLALRLGRPVTDELWHWLEEMGFVDDAVGQRDPAA